METALKSVTTRHGEWSEVMIYNSSYGYAIGRLMLDPFSVLLYSTQAHEYASIQKLGEDGHTIEEAIDLMIEQQERKTVYERTLVRYRPILGSMSIRISHTCSIRWNLTESLPYKVFFTKHLIF